jgi:hypothetical protein
LARRSGVGDLATFLDRRDRPGQVERLEDAKAPSRMVEMAEREAFEDRAAGWLAMMDQADDLNPVTRACMGFHLWHVAELSPVDDPLEAAVTASRVAITEIAPSGTMPGAIFAPIAMGGGGGFRTIGDPPARLARWLNAMESATFAALRRLEEIEDRYASGNGSAQHRLDGRAGPHPGSYWAGTIPNVADR